MPHESDNECKLQPVCNVIFDQLRDSIAALAAQQDKQHEEMLAKVELLTNRIQNGITARIMTTEATIAAMQAAKAVEEQAAVRRLARSARWETAIICVFVTAASAVTWWVITEFAKAHMGKPPLVTKP